MGLEIVAILVSAIAGATSLQSVLKAALESESLRKAVKSIRARDIVAITFMGLGIASLLLSYFGWYWVRGPRLEWWQSLHLELGVALLLIGFVDTIVMTRLTGEGMPRIGQTAGAEAAPPDPVGPRAADGVTRRPERRDGEDGDEAPSERPLV